MPSRLKSLELHGYKTFANRTLFEFAETVTAVVGPNGSGKSNIADSLRWVLGEQSYGLLRAKKTEDMIFGGSESRARAGMASATITFDNSDNWLPIDFSEVAITRRAYRDGQNEYLINGQRVRLRDVSELLSQSGLAERTYTVIGQGLVDAVLSLKAEERRRLFEEAAGIGLHRARRDEALRRLEITRRNLERVEDILAELRPRLTSLERQARRALEYDQVRADLQVMLHEWYGYHWHRLQEELTEARQAARSQEVRLAQARQEQDAQAETLSGLRQRLQASRAELNAWHRTLAEQHARREALGRQMAVAEERLRSLNEQQENVQSEITSSQAEQAFFRDQVEAADQETRSLESELGEARLAAEAARQAFAARQDERLRLESDLQDRRRRLAELNESQVQLQARQAERQAQAGRTQQALEATRQAAGKAAQEVQAAQAALQAARLAEQDTEKALKSAEQALSAQRQRIQTAEAKRQQAAEERLALQAELARLAAQWDVLQQAEAALTGYASGTRLLLQAARQQKLSGARGALNNFLDVPDDLELAISAALGEYIDAVVLDAEADEALDMLQSETGRAVLLPLSGIKAPAALKPVKSEEPGYLGIASQLVNAPSELRPAVDLLLGQALVVRDRRSARSLLQGQPAGVRAVTLRGEVFHASGPVHSLAGGSQEADQTLLSRSRQSRLLAKQREDDEKRLSRLLHRLEKAEADWLASQELGKQLEGDLEEKRQAHEIAGRLAHQAGLALEQAGRQTRWQDEQRQRLESELSQGAAEAAQISAGLLELQALLEQERSEVRRQAEALEALSLDEFQSQVMHWSTLSAVSERALAGARARQAERQAALDRLERFQAGLQARLAEMQAALQDLEANRPAWRQEEVQLAEEIKAVQARIEPAEAALEILERDQAELELSETASRHTVSSAEHFNAQARITLARRQEALQSLQHRIEDDFGLVAFEYAEQVSGPTPLPLAGMVEQLPRVSQLSADIEESIQQKRSQLRRMGSINPEARAEYQEVKGRFKFLTEQVADLKQAEGDVRQVIAELDDLMQREFHRTFDLVADEFRQTFVRLFGGGSARLELTDPEHMTDTGIDIEARLPGRRAQSLALLSGGERSLAATALIFSLLKVSPTPFCVLDEVDAMLDEVNVGRFRELLTELSQNTQFVIITHNRNTVQVADVIYGVTMGRDSASQVLSLKLDEVGKVVENV